MGWPLLYAQRRQHDVVAVLYRTVGVSSRSRVIHDAVVWFHLLSDKLRVYRGVFCGLSCDGRGIRVQEHVATNDISSSSCVKSV